MKSQCSKFSTKIKLIFVCVELQFWDGKNKLLLPSATPQGYRLPRTLRPSISITVFAPTIANGTRLRKARNAFASSSSSSGSGKS